MKLVSALAVFATLLAPTVAHAQDEQQGGWSVTVTPRYQHAFFKPDVDADDFETIPTFGGTVTVREPSARFGITGTYLKGEADGVYTYDGGPDYSYDLEREELQFLLEYTPRQTGVTFLAGFHRFEGKNGESLVGGDAVRNEVGSYSQSIDAYEIGLRIASRLGAESRHAVSLQVLAGIGDSKSKADVVETFAGEDFVTDLEDSGTGYTGDFALGYNYFLTNRITVGTRMRGYIYDAKGADVVYAITPEANFSFRF